MACAERFTMCPSRSRSSAAAVPRAAYLKQTFPSARAVFGKGARPYFCCDREQKGILAGIDIDQARLRDCMEEAWAPQWCRNIGCCQRHCLGAA